MSKLLSIPFKWFTLYALIILSASIPVYFLVVESIWLEELDEKNWTVVKRMELGLKTVNPEKADLSKTIAVWNSLQPETKLIPLTGHQVPKTTWYTDEVYNPFEKETDRFRVLSTTIYIREKPYLVRVSSNIEEADETLGAIACITVLFFVLLVVGFIVLNKIISKKSWKPFYNTLDRLKQFDIHKNEKINLDNTRIEEFQQLNSEITSLVDKNSTAFNQQKRFVENASHELQTPLAVLKSKMDVLLQDETFSEAHSKTLDSIHSSLSRITRINKNLLLLAKIENHQFTEKTSVDLRKTILEISDLLQDYAENKGMQIQTDVTSFEMLCNPTLLEVLFNNLIINAIRHGNPNEQIQIRMTGNQLTFSNAGNEPLDESRLFVRFAISSNETTNSGLGLAISKEICDRYHWVLSYSFTNQLHRFTIEF